MTGLREHRALHAFQTYVYPRLEREIHYCAGFNVPIEVEWETLAEKDMAHAYAKNFTKVYFIPLIEALRQVTLDDLGSDALRNSLRKIAITNRSGNWDNTNLAKFDDGVLMIDHAPHSNVEYIKERVDALVQVLESRL